VSEIGPTAPVSASDIEEPPRPEAAAMDVDVASGRVAFRGPWTLGHVPALARQMGARDLARYHATTWDMGGLTALDTAGACLIQRTRRDLESRGLTVTLRDLRPPHAVLLDMVRVDAGVPLRPSVPSALERLGRRVWDRWLQVFRFLAFIGETGTVQAALLLRPRRMRWKALAHGVVEVGFNALPIVGLLSFLVGVVIAYQSAVQLRQYGANIYLADLVGLSMLRELAGLLTAIIVAGRSGSAFTAQIGTMQATEEVDALRTLGIAPVEVLVVPKVWALILALPLLTVFADALGVAGGMLMGSVVLGVSAPSFLDRFREAVSLTDFLVGVGKAPVFAVIITLVGCFQGFQVRGGAESVGRQTTISVVQGIFFVIVADAAFSVAFSWLGI
jgi:phospholipid/cholesterol/gamma-HCH transport system permease protein